VLQEFYVTVTRKLGKPLRRQTARPSEMSWRPTPPGRCTVPNDVVFASQLEERHQLSFWDGLIVVSALRSGAGELLTEDLRDGQSLDGLLVVNPFRVVRGARQASHSRRGSSVRASFLADSLRTPSRRSSAVSRPRMHNRAMAEPDVDPIRVRRARIARAVSLAQRVGYTLWLVAIVVFVIGAATTFRPAMVTIVIGCLAVGSALLAPSIVISYGVRAAEREDRRG
jgi:hypothetical protein